ncbi:hypothetical protein, partial [Vibrio parahaemolyticus]|uniref:hypothetical protein n=1 Tax=Vibrio parahaemolyticus TaxID=670 RepID=UPI001BB083E1
SIYYNDEPLRRRVFIEAQSAKNIAYKWQIIKALRVNFRRYSMKKLIDIRKLPRGILDERERCKL